MPQETLKKAVEHLNKGEHEQALAAARQVLQSSPENHEALHHAGLAAASLGQTATAVNYLNRALSLAPANTHYLSNQMFAANLARETDNLRDAEDLLNKLLGTSRDLKEIVLIRLTALYAQQDKSEAISELLAKHGQEGSAAFHLCRAVLFYLQGRHVEKESAFLSSLRVRSSFSGSAPLPSSKRVMVTYGTDQLPVSFHFAGDILVELEGGHFNANLLLQHTKEQITRQYVFADAPLPTGSVAEQDLIINCISDPEVQGKSLQSLERSLRDSQVPVMNAPEAVLSTGRVDIHQRLREIPGVLSPETRRIDVPHDVDDATKIISQLPGFPVLIRPLGSSTGIGLRKLDSETAIREILPELSGGTYNVCSYHDFRSPDGYYRKYRVFFIGNQMLPEHCVIHDHWNVHSSSRMKLMKSNVHLQAEEKRFVYNPSDVLSEAQLTSLKLVCENINLDYFGVDFTLVGNKILVFEANPAMRINPDYCDHFPYLSQPITALVQKFNQLIELKLRG